MVRINKIYTRTGDDGTTGLVGGERIEKDSLRVSTYGEIDELNSFIGQARTLAQQSASEIATKLATIQNELFDIGASLASPSKISSDKNIGKSFEISPEQIARLESWIDEVTAGIPELRSFVLPGGTELNAALHVARAVCRRAERAIVTLRRTETVDAGTLQYINRLSDLLFALARKSSFAENAPEYLWEPGKK